jgi:WD40 repeat protein
MSVVDAHFDPATQEELVVWSAGEDIVARFRERQGRGQVSKSSWYRLGGKELGFASGYDDIKAIKIIQRGSGQAIITSRHNGQLYLLSAERDRFGECIAKLTPGFDSSSDSQKPLEQETTNSLDVLDDGRKRLLAAAERSCLRIYELPDGDITETNPLTAYDVGDSARLGGARWMEQGKSIALALSGTQDPLRYLALTPSGWTLHAAAKSERVAQEFDIKYDRTISSNSLEPVRRHAGAKGAASLLLSSWKDGTIR